MKISYSWLKKFIEINESPEEVSKLLTSSGLEVEDVQKVETIQGGLEGLVIGEVISCEKHPNADKLSKTTVDIGGEELSPIVCGAPNVAAGQKVVVATVGSTLYPAGHDPFKIKKAKIRGEVSLGMICAEDEIGLGTSHDGIMVLDTDLPNGAPARDYFDIEEDYAIEIGLTPNRVDAASHFGVARDLQALLERPTLLPDVSAFKVDNHDLPISVLVENNEACPRYAGVSITGVTVKDSPEWLQNRLKSIGLAPVNNVVDITNYVLHSLGQPLHAFDADEIAGTQVVVKTLEENTKFVTLDGVERSLKNKDLMICNAEEGMCIAGVFGGEKSGVKPSTKDIFLESAYFSPDYVRKTSMVHDLKTDAAFRFERGTDPNQVIIALKWAALLIQEMAGGEISSEIVDVYPSEIKPFETQVKYKNIDRLIGKELGKERIKKILSNLEIKITDETEVGFKAIIPTYRVDVQREADIIEEILRIYGYDNVELSENLKADSLAHFPTKDRDNLRLKASTLLTGQGFYETMSNSLTSSKYTIGSEVWNAEDNVSILNQLSEELDVMRQTLLFSGLEAIAHNINRKQFNLKFFEFGSTYAKGKKGYVEKKRLSLFVVGKRQEESWTGDNNKVDFFDLSRVTNWFLSRFNLSDTKSIPTSAGEMEYGLDLVASNHKTLVSLGKVKKDLTKKAGVSADVFYADIDWDLLVKLWNPEVSVREIPKFPEVKRDLSIVLDKAVKFSDIEGLAKKYGRDLLKRMNVFSVYEGENIGEGKKSYAISYILQDASKTLTDKQIDKVMNQLIAGYEKEFGAVIRK